MRLLALLLIAACAAPAASACSIALTDLADVDAAGDVVVVQRGTRVAVIDWTTGFERTVGEDFFPEFEAGPNGRVLLSAQRGLGADCSGDRYVGLFDTTGSVAEWSGAYAIAAWGDGFVLADGGVDAYDWAGQTAVAPGFSARADARLAASLDGQTFVVAQHQARVYRDGEQVAIIAPLMEGLKAVAAGDGAAVLSSDWTDEGEVAVLHWWDGQNIQSVDLPRAPAWPGSLVAYDGDYWFAAGGDLWRLDPVEGALERRMFEGLSVGGVGTDGAVIAVGLAKDEYLGEGAGVLRIEAGGESYREAPDSRTVWQVGQVPGSTMEAYTGSTEQPPDSEGPGQPPSDDGSEQPPDAEPVPGIGPLAVLVALGLAARGRARNP